MKAACPRRKSLETRNIYQPELGLRCVRDVRPTGWRLCPTRGNIFPVYKTTLFLELNVYDSIFFNFQFDWSSITNYSFRFLPKLYKIPPPFFRT